MCMALRDVISSILAIFSSSRSVSQDELDNDPVEALTARHESTLISSHTRFVTTIGGVQVSLVLAVFTHHYTSSGFFHQRTTARWTLSTADHFAVFVQEPTQIFRSVTFPVFKSYAVSLVEIISRRSVDWTISGKWIWTTTTVNEQVTRTAPKELDYNGEKDEENECVAKDKIKNKWTVNPRYLDYERTWTYSSKRQENLERRRLQQRKRRSQQKSP